VERTPHQPDQTPGTSTNTDEATSAEAWQLAQASRSAKLAAALRHAPPPLYGRFAAYRELLALSRAHRRKLLRGMSLSMAGAALTFALATGHVPAARAAGISVGGGCTLADAITAANTDTATGGCTAGSGADTITLSGDVILTSVNNTTSGGNGLPLITSTITIEGAGFTIARDPGAPDFRILYVEVSGNLTLNDTTVTGGVLVPYQGGGIYIKNGGTLTLTSSTISGNSAASGGGISSYGTLTITSSTISGNNASYSRGGGLSSNGPTAISNSTFSGNSAAGGGGISSQNTLTLTSSTISGNNGGGNSDGGGLSSIGQTTISNSTFSGNSAGDGGGISSQNTLTITFSTISGNNSNNGGGILNHASLTITSSTISSNIAIVGGGLMTSSGIVMISNSTISGNRATKGGGLNNSLGSEATMSNSTIIGNTAYSPGGGIFNGGTLTLVSSLIAGNAAPSGAEIANAQRNHPGPPPGIINAANFNLFGHSGASNGQAFVNFSPSGSDISATSDGTAPAALSSILDTTLQDNGGDTQTHALVAGSPAIDAVQDGPSTDQRGVSRPQGAAFDIGAFELEPIVPTSTPANTPTATGTPTNTPTVTPPVLSPRAYLPGIVKP
jgi:predicted outer membrane repeat protein